jgi:flagellar hook-associated protein 2
LGQGINVQQFVEYAVANQTAAITALQTQQTTLGSQTGEIATITSDLAALGTAAAALSDPLGALSSEAATSSNSAAVTATASGIATAGAHTVTVANLATTSSFYSDEVATSSTSLGTGDTIDISVGGKSVSSISVTSANNTLDQLATAINLSTSAVQASVINDANGARLAIVSTTSGAPGNVGVTGSLHLANATAINFHQASAGLNANLTVDGIPIASTSNTVSNAINGVTLNLTGPTAVGSPVSLTVAPDTAQATTAINALVTAYNTVVTEINGQFKVAADGTGGGVLESDNTLREVQNSLLSAVSNSISGNNGIVNLASIGVNLQDDGTLSVDSGALASALSSNYASVQNLLQNSTTGLSQNFSQVISSITGPGNGLLTVDAASIASTTSGLTSQISDMQAALAAQELNLTSVYSTVNATLQELPLLESQMTQQLAAI